MTYAGEAGEGAEAVSAPLAQAQWFSEVSTIRSGRLMV